MQDADGGERDEREQPPAAAGPAVLVRAGGDRRRRVPDGRRADGLGGPGARRGAPRIVASVGGPGEREQPGAGGRERVDERVGVGEARDGILLQRLQHDLLEPGRDLRVVGARRHRRLADLLERDRDGAVAVERHAPGEHLVEHDADRVEVGLLADRVALRLLGREVLRGAHDRPGLRHVRRAGAGDAEVGDGERCPRRPR